MTISDKIQLIAICVTTITSIVSIVIAVKSLKQTNKSILDANKLDISIYTDYIQVDSTRMNYLIVKNFGKSSAIIDSIEYSNDNFYANMDKPFYNLSNCSIAPNQSFSTRVLYKKNPYISFDIIIKYHDNIDSYTKVFSINTEAMARQIVALTTNSSQGELEKTISIIGQELIRKNM
ncbi:MAG: hypothetical protein ACRCVJ_12380 [Clostridium sp.]|uniref:hypothetical protein n=1 Tax=Clostridium sp. TaxID=1506 RepID=UPI003F31C8FB